MGVRPCLDESFSLLQAPPTLAPTKAPTVFPITQCAGSNYRCSGGTTAPTAIVSVNSATTCSTHCRDVATSDFAIFKPNPNGACTCTTGACTSVTSGSNGYMVYRTSSKVSWAESVEDSKIISLANILHTLDSSHVPRLEFEGRSKSYGSQRVLSLM